MYVPTLSLQIAKEKTIRYWKQSKRGDNDSIAKSNNLGLRIELETRHFGDVVVDKVDTADGSRSVAIKCIAQIGSNSIETEKVVSTIYANRGYGTRLVFHGPFSIGLLFLVVAT